MTTPESMSKRPVGRPRKGASGAEASAPAQLLPTESYSNDTQAIAKDLANFIQTNKLSTQVQGKEFVNVEGWQYAGSRLGILPVVEHLESRSTEQELKYEAKVTLLQLSSGLTVGAGFAICSNKESGKQRYQEFAIASMAQTRAIGKAYRNILAWIIRAAGYEATPAEEMDYTSAAPAAAAPQPVAAASPSGAPSRITLQAPVPLATVPAPLPAPTPTPTPTPTPQPTMQVSTRRGSAADAVAARNERLRLQGVVMISELQKDLIYQLLQCPGIEKGARSTTLLNYLRFTRERANISISKLVTAIKSQDAAALPENLLRKLAAIKEEGEQLLRQPEREAAAAELRQFVHASAEQLGKSAADRLLSICENVDYSAQQLLSEKAEYVQFLAQSTTAAAA